MRRIARWLGRIIAGVLLIGLMLWLVAYGRQWLLRSRAGRLLADIQALQVQKSSWADAQKLMTRWGGWGSYQGTCDVKDCYYWISMSVILPPIHHDEEGIARAPRIFDYVGLRSSAAGADFRVRNGIIVEKSSTEFVELPERARFFGNELIGELAVSSSEDSRLRVESSLLVMHANRSIRHVKSDYGLNVRFTPEESVAEQSALMAFKFDCITRLVPCTSLGDILPAAYSELQENEQAFQAKRAQTLNLSEYAIVCDVNPRVISRKYHDVLQAEVLTSDLMPKITETDLADPQTYWIATVRLKKVLKGVAPIQVGDTLTLQIPAGDGKEPLAPASHFPYQEVILAGESYPEPYGSQHLVFTVRNCGTFNATPENMRLSEQGVLDDFDPGN